MQPITSTCKPRTDVLEGQLADQHFAAQLWGVVTRPDEYRLYGDADDFFALTYPTGGLKKLLRRVFGRLTGGVVEADSGVIRSETSFGGGKTHGLIALHHLASGARPANIHEFVDPALIPDKCRSVALVGDVIDPVNGSQAPDGTRVRTLWGELAAQLGTGAWAELKGSDEKRTRPGSDTLRRALGDEPVVVMIDEIAHYVATLKRSGDEDIRRLAESTSNFLKVLFETAMANKNLVVVITLATAQDAFAEETAEIKDAIETVLAEVGSVVDRQKSAVQPAEDVEIAAIVKRRLFEHIDEDEARKAAASYADLYTKVAERGEHLPGATDNPAKYTEGLANSYPFHPELFRVFDEKLSTIPGFQRTRGALRLLATAVRTLWTDPVDDALEEALDVTEEAPPVINVADMPLHDQDLLYLFTENLRRGEFQQVAQADIVGDDGHAVLVAKKLGNDKPVRAAVTAFLHSLERTSVAGATRGDLLLGTMRPGDDPSSVADALADVAEIAWHLDVDGHRYRFSPEANVNKIISEETKSLLPGGQAGSKVLERIDEIVHDLFKAPTDPEAKKCMVVDVFPSGGPKSVKDEPRLHLAVLHHEDLTVTDATAIPPPDQLIDAVENYGEGFRKNRNGIAFAVADGDLVAKMSTAVARRIAAQSLAESDERMRQLGSDKMRDDVRKVADETALDARIAVASCYSHIYWPEQDPANGNLRHGALTPAQKGDVSRPASDRVWALLDQSQKIQKGELAPSWLKQKAWPKGNSAVATTAVRDHFWRDPVARLVPDDATIISAIRTGARNEEWVYYDANGGSYLYGNKGKATPILDPNTFIATHDHAVENDWVIEPLADDEVHTALPVGDAQPVSLADLRTQLEKRRGHDLEGTEVRSRVEALVRGGRAVATLEGDDTPLPPATLDKHAYDTVFVRQTEGPKPKTLNTFSGSGTVGKALTTALANATDRINAIDDAAGLTSLSVRFDLDKDGTRAKSALTLPSMAQKVPMRVHVSGVVELDKEMGSVTLNVTLTKDTLSSGRDVVTKAIDAAVDVSGSVAVTCRWDDPVPVDHDDVKTIREQTSIAFSDVSVQVTGEVG